MNKGLSSDAADIMLSSITKSTLKQYDSSLKQWWSFTRDKNYVIHNTDEFKIIEFLTLRFKNGCKYGTLNTDNAAIALITYENHSEEKLTKRFMRGILKKRPTRVKYATTWDANCVLEYIDTMPDISK